jgi:hypothetical protein
MLSFGAQTSTAQVSIGPNVGLNWTHFSIDHNYLLGTPLMGSSFGAIAQLPLNGILSIRVEPSYIQKGIQWPFGGEGPTSYLINSYFNYFQLPIELKANLPIPVVSPYILVGPNIGYLLSAKQGLAGSTPQEDITDDYQKVDCALDFGAGLDFGITPFTTASCNVKYSSGLLIKGKTSVIDLQTHGVQIYISVLFSI